MTVQDILDRRLHNQHLVGKKFDSPEKAVDWFGAVQAQEYAPAKWALGKRINNATNAMLDEAFNDGRILRTHVMRPTWHFVTPQDIRWMLKLTAPRVKRFMSSYNKKLELNEKVFKKSNTTIEKILINKKITTRADLKIALENIGINTDIQRLAHLVMNAELDGIICSGPRLGKQFTYTLLEERVPKIKSLDRDEALSLLTRKYFRSHGPATLQDFSWWSGLTIADAKQGIAMNKSELLSDVCDKKIYFSLDTLPLGKIVSPTAYLLSVYDEYTIAYKDRSALFNPKFKVIVGNAVYNLVLIIDGRIAGLWKRIFKKDTVVVTVNPYKTLSRADTIAVAAAAENYSKFVGLKLELR